LIVAELDDKLVSREHLQIKLVSGMAEFDAPHVEFSNLSRKRSLIVDGYRKLAPGESTQVATPVRASFEGFDVRVEAREAGMGSVKELPHPTLAPGKGGLPSQSLVAQMSGFSSSADEQYSTEQLIHWLGETMEVLQSAAGASDFLAQAVDAVDRIIGLDTITALRFEGGRWRIACTKDAKSSQLGFDARPPSSTILKQLLVMKRTIRQLPGNGSPTDSLQGVKALVVSPILDPNEEVIGALYGTRYGSSSAQLPQISELEATMVEVIACSAAAGIAREFEQQKAMAARVQFEQFFTPRLARELENDPRMLEGHEANISVLFCDIVRFSSISQRIGSQTTLRWISGVMDKLSEVVLDHEGVVVDYIGDELMAMWGAPKAQADHALKACKAACDLLRCKELIDRQWLQEIGQPIDFRTGICSGVASVGNIGSSMKFKYGPLGDTVNLASRLQGAGKHFGVRQLISRATADSLQASQSLVCRPLGTTRLANMAHPIEVFELCEEYTPRFNQLALAFADIIDAIKRSDFAKTWELLKHLASSYPEDRPTQLLVQRLSTGERMDPACLWRFDAK
jgi:adenylate cyclase